MNTVITLTLTTDELRAIIRDENEAYFRRIGKGDPLLTPMEVARRIKKSTQTVRRLTEKGVLVNRSTGGRPRYLESEVINLK